MSEDNLTVNQWYQIFLSQYMGIIEKSAWYYDKNPHTRNDLIQEILCNTWKYAEKMMKLEEKAMVRYLKNIIRTCAADHFKPSEHREIPADNIEALCERQSCDEASEPESYVIHKVDMEIFNRMRNDDRRLLRLRIEYKLSYKEIGENMGITEAAARKRYERIIRKLRENNKND